MNSREKILQAIGQNKPPLSYLPDTVVFDAPDVDLAAAFTQALQSIGGTCIHAPDYAFIRQHLCEHRAQPERVVNRVEGLDYPSLDLDALGEEVQELQKLDLAILEGALGVAENAAIWVDERHLGLRVLPFICQHLVLILPRKNLVGNMHQAYQQLPVKQAGYGVFIAGPSKTADIEQSLVIGAHGPRSLLVYLVEHSTSDHD